MNTQEKKQKSVLLSKAHDLTAFTSKDKSRYVLMNVHVNTELSQVEATDGRIAVALPVEMDGTHATGEPEPGKQPNTLIPCRLLKRAVSTIRRHAKIFVPMSEHARLERKENQVSLVTADGDDMEMVSCKAPEGDYPRVQDVLGVPDGALVEISISADYLRKIGNYVSRHGTDKRVKFRFYGPLKPIMFTAVIDTPLIARTLTGTLMPMQ